MFGAFVIWKMSFGTLLCVIQVARSNSIRPAVMSETTNLVICSVMEFIKFNHCQINDTEVKSQSTLVKFSIDNMIWNLLVIMPTVNVINNNIIAPCLLEYLRGLEVLL